MFDSSHTVPQERKFISFEYWNLHVRTLDYDDLVYGHENLPELVENHPETKDGLTRFLYEIVLRRMEIRDKSRSVNSIDVVFNFDCIGFTGGPQPSPPTAVFIIFFKKQYNCGLYSSASGGRSQYNLNYLSIID